MYALPPLTEKDQAAVKEAEAMAPADTGARIDLSLERVSTPVAGDAVREWGECGGRRRRGAAAAAAAGEQGTAPVCGGSCGRGRC